MSTPTFENNSPPARMADLAASALLGTERSAGKLGGNAAQRLLLEAAVLGTRRRAGQVPSLAKDAIPECPPDPLRPVGTASAATLRQLLGNPDELLIEEWAELAAARGLRVPDALAAAMLDWWSSKPRDSRAIRAALGVRLDWLGSLNPAWSGKSVRASLPQDLEQVWQTGALPERLTMLKAVRRIEPARAEGLLRSTWDQDNADERKRFVERFADGLSMADEPFLEWVLDDRSKQARAAASELLAKLPQSRLLSRMVERAAAMIRIEPGKRGLLRRSPDKILIEPPQEWDAAWERDGLEEKPPGGIGKRAWWLQQIFSVAPPQKVSDRSGVARDKLLEAVGESDYAEQALHGLCAGAAGSRDAVWCSELAARLLLKKAIPLDLLKQLWQSLPDAESESLLLRVLKADELPWDDRCHLFGSVTGRRSRTFSELLCRALNDARPEKLVNTWSAQDACDRAGYWLHPDALPEYELLLKNIFRKELHPSASRSVDRVRFRADMHKEFAS
jgi:hypothetical protein